jgi:L-threonylcarbamoyladenylate synthase
MSAPSVTSRASSVSSTDAADLGAADARRLQECLAAGGVAVFPADTVYGICCDPDDADAVRRVYELKGRPAERPAAVMFFALAPADSVVAEPERVAVRALLPGPVTVLVPNRERRFLPACGPDPGTLGLRVPALPRRLAALRAVTRPLMQSSANLSGEPDARRLSEVPERLLDGVDLVLDGGELPGSPSTVVDLRGYARDGGWQTVREGAVSSAAVAAALASAG